VPSNLDLTKHERKIRIPTVVACGTGLWDRWSRGRFHPAESAALFVDASASRSTPAKLNNVASTPL
jgi:hypothetical protein